MKTVDDEVKSRRVKVLTKLGVDDPVDIDPPDKDALDYFINDVIELIFRAASLQDRNDLMAGVLGRRASHVALREVVGEIEATLEQRLADLVKIRRDLIKIHGALGEPEYVS